MKLLKWVRGNWEGVAVVRRKNQIRSCSEIVGNETFLGEAKKEKKVVKGGEKSKGDTPRTKKKKMVLYRGEAHWKGGTKVEVSRNRTVFGGFV